MGLDGTIRFVDPDLLVSAFLCLGSDMPLVRRQVRLVDRLLLFADLSTREIGGYDDRF